MRMSCLEACAWYVTRADAYVLPFLSYKQGLLLLLLLIVIVIMVTIEKQE
jgi:hypothetical protein